MWMRRVLTIAVSDQLPLIGMRRMWPESTAQASGLGRRLCRMKLSKSISFLPKTKNGTHKMKLSQNVLKNIKALFSCLQITHWHLLNIVHSRFQTQTPIFSLRESAGIATHWQWGNVSWVWMPAPMVEEPHPEVAARTSKLGGGAGDIEVSHPSLPPFYYSIFFLLSRSGLSENFEVWDLHHPRAFREETKGLFCRSAGLANVFGLRNLQSGFSVDSVWPLLLVCLSWLLSASQQCVGSSTVVACWLDPGQSYAGWHGQSLPLSWRLASCLHFPEHMVLRLEVEAKANIVVRRCWTCSACAKAGHSSSTCIHRTGPSWWRGLEWSKCSASLPFGCTQEHHWGDGRPGPAWATTP